MYLFLWSNIVAENQNAQNATIHWRKKYFRPFDAIGGKETALRHVLSHFEHFYRINWKFPFQRQNIIQISSVLFAFFRKSSTFHSDHRSITSKGDLKFVSRMTTFPGIFRQTKKKCIKQRAILFSASVEVIQVV